MQIATDFEGGRIELRASSTSARASQPLSERRPGAEEHRVVLAIPPDAKANFRQWFAFDAIGAPGAVQRFSIENAGDCTWGDGFGGLYKVFASYDEEHWFRVETTYANKRLSFHHTPSSGGRVRYAYYPPYTSARLARSLVSVRTSPLASAGMASCKPLVTTARGAQLHHVEIGRVEIGRVEIGRVEIGAESTMKHVWVIAQQHSGEAMAGWFAEGLIERLLADDATARAVRERARVHIVPRMNPDGCALGNHRTNEAGLDLNREWGTLETKSVEVKAVRDAMKASGAAMFLDVHGDERLPYVFAQPSDRYAGRAPRVLELEERFGEIMRKHDASFQTEHHYPLVQRDKPNRAIASTWAQTELGAIAFTLEMPFTDAKNAPSPEGWSPERAKALGSAFVDALDEMLPQL
jgi:murein tripeptide amidase MpaA